MKKAAAVLLVFLTIIACNAPMAVQIPVPSATAAPSATAVPSATPVPSAIAVPSATPIPSATAVPTATPSQTSSPVPVDAAEFIGDVTIPDGTHLSPGESFIKTWRLRNSGTSTWTRAYSLVFANGSQMNGLSLIPLLGTVAPGGVIDVSVTLVAPNSPGTYKGYWELRSATGILFGVSPNAEKPFSVNIKVN